MSTGRRENRKIKVRKLDKKEIKRENIFDPGWYSTAMEKERKQIRLKTRGEFKLKKQFFSASELEEEKETQ